MSNDKKTFTKDTFQYVVQGMVSKAHTRARKTEAYEYSDVVQEWDPDLHKLLLNVSAEQKKVDEYLLNRQETNKK